MFLVDVIKCPLHGNSYIFVISKNQNHARLANIEHLIDDERRKGLLSPETYVKYAERCENVAKDFKSVVEQYWIQGYKIVGYGAAAKGMTVLNYTGVRMSYVIDDNPLKQGKFTPGLAFPIVSNDILKSDTNKILFVPLAWNFFDEIKNKIKSIRTNPEDKFCTYFPSVKVSS
jgi:hypothetical protein